MPDKFFDGAWFIVEAQYTLRSEPMSASKSKGKSEKAVFVCDTCGSEDVVVDAWAYWEKKNRRWRLANTYDASHRNNCDEERSIKVFHFAKALRRSARAGRQEHPDLRE
jgi:hypothetical protein